MFNLGTSRKKDKDKEKSISTPTIFSPSTGTGTVGKSGGGTVAHKDVSSPVENVMKFTQGGGFGGPGGTPGSGDDVAGGFKEEDKADIEKRFEIFLVCFA